MNITLKVTIWWEERHPNVIKICTGDRRFVNDQGAKHGLVGTRPIRSWDAQYR